MDLISLLLVVALIGAAVWAITTFIPMPEPFPKVIIAIAVIVIVLYLIRTFTTLPNVLH